MSKRAKWKILGTAGSVSSAFRFGARVARRLELHEVRRAVAGRELDKAQPVAMRFEPERFGIDGDRALREASRAGRLCAALWKA